MFASPFVVFAPTARGMRLAKEVANYGGPMRFEPRNCNLSTLLIGALALGACGDQPADTATSGQPEPLVQDVNYGTWAAGLQAPGNLLATHSTLLRNNKI